MAQFGTLLLKRGFFAPSGNGSKQKRKAVAVCYCNGFKKWCRGRDSNPHRNSHYHLKIACLPIPPPRREKRYMQNRGGWQAFFCDSVKFFRLSAWGPGLFPCAGVTDGSSGEEPHSLLWKGRRNLFVSAAEGSFLGAAEPSAWESRFDPHARGGWQRRKDALFLQSVEKSCLAGLLHVNAGGIG